MILANPVEPADFGPFENPWGNPHKPGGGTYVRGRHGGLDFSGTYWIACVSGTVRWRNYGAAYGVQAQIDFDYNGHTYEATYAHGAAVYLDPGSHIEAGERLGKVGASGQVTGPHLHWELHETPGDWYSDFNPLGAVMASLSQQELEFVKDLYARIKGLSANPGAAVAEAVKLVQGKRKLPLAALPAHDGPGSHSHEISGTAT